MPSFMASIINKIPFANLFAKHKDETKTQEHNVLSKTQGVRYGKQSLWGKEIKRERLPPEFLGNEQIYKDRQETKPSKSEKHILRKYYILPSGNIIPALKIPSKNVNVSTDMLAKGKNKTSVRFISSPREDSEKTSEMSMDNASGSIVIHFHGKKKSDEIHDVNLERTDAGDILISPVDPDADLTEETQGADGAEPKGKKRLSVHFDQPEEELDPQTNKGKKITTTNATGSGVISKYVVAGDEQIEEVEEPEESPDAIGEEESETESPGASDSEEALLTDNTDAPVQESHCFYRMFGMAWKVVENVAIKILCPFRQAIPSIFCSKSFCSRSTKVNDQE